MLKKIIYLECLFLILMSISICNVKADDSLGIGTLKVIEYKINVFNGKNYPPPAISDYLSVQNPNSAGATKTVTYKYYNGGGLTEQNIFNLINSKRLEYNVAGMGICIYPNRGSQTNFHGEHVLNPRNTAAEAAIIRAYQLSIANGLIYPGIYTEIVNNPNNLEVQNKRKALNLIFRWISDRVGWLHREAGAYSDHHIPYIWENNQRWSGEYVSLARSIVNQAYKVYLLWTQYDESLKGNYSSDLDRRDAVYRKLVDEGYFWDGEDQFTNSKIEVTRVDDYKFTATFRIRASQKIDKVRWDKFKINCSDAFNCAIDVKEDVTDSHLGYVTIQMRRTDGTKLTEQKFRDRINITYAYSAIKDGSSHVWKMQPDVSGYQVFIFLKDYDEDTFVTEFDWEPDNDDFADNCVCQIKNGKYTGKYEVYKEDSEGNTEVYEFPFSNTEKAEKYECPKSEKCKNPEDDDKKCVCEEKDGEYTGYYVYTEVNYKGEETVRKRFKVTNEEKAKEYGCEPCKDSKKCVCEEKDGKYTGYYVYTEVNYKGEETVRKRFKTTNEEKAKQYGCEPCKETVTPKRSCVCQKYNDLFTGYYEYEEKSGDAVKKGTFSYKDTENVEKYGCEPYDECLGKCQILDGKYYFEQKEVSKQKYQDECVKSCRVEGGTYYCKSTNGIENGRVCSLSEYEKECECPKLKTDCDNSGNPNSAECQNYNYTCASCSAYVSIPNGCTGIEEEESFTGTISDINIENTACNSSVNDVKACVLGKEDQAGTSFEATKELSGNSYCHVWCKERYDFTLPTARYTTSGGYFTLSSSVIGQRDCYVSGSSSQSSIDFEGFKNEIKSLAKQMIDAYNSYSEQNAYYYAVISTSVKTEKRQKVVVNEEGEEEIVEEEVEVPQTFSYSYTVYDTNTYALSTRYNSFVATRSSLNGVSPGSFNASYISDQIKNKIQEFNQCTKGWSNDMNFDPIIEFTYDEDYSKQNIMSGELEMLSKSGSGSDMYCTGDIDNQYNCLGTSTTSSGDNSLYEELKFPTCDYGGCSVNSEKISKAKWIRKSKSYSANFAPNNNFSTYTQYGTIKNDTTICGSEGSCLFTRLPSNALPVEMSTGKGVFPFKFTFKNIGQSNSSGDLGRLINGSNNSVLTAYAKSSGNKCEVKNGATPTADGSYVCQYVNNCDECKFTCDDGNCIIDEECSGDDCPLKCPNCVFDGIDDTFTYRSISNTNLFPNSREVGYNWDSLSNVKAKVTKEAIESAGDGAYNTPQYSYTITPTNINNIKRYDRNAGTYTDSSLSCKNITINGIDYSYGCTSSFLDEGESKGYFKENERNAVWTLWSDTEYCLNGSCLSKEKGIGPSWK